MLVIDDQELIGWYNRTDCTPEETTAREIIDKIGKRGYLAAGADLTFMSRLIERAIVEARLSPSLLVTSRDH
jgi:hypothetical protein